MFYLWGFVLELWSQRFSLQLGWVESDLHTRAGGLTNSQQQRSAAHGQHSAPSCAQAGGEGGGSRGAAHLPPPPVPRMDGWNSSVMPVRGRGLPFNPHPPGSFFYEPPTGRSLHNDGGDDDNNKRLITVITKPAPAAPGRGTPRGASLLPVPAPSP